MNDPRDDRESRSPGASRSSIRSILTRPRRPSTWAAAVVILTALTAGAVDLATRHLAVSPSSPSTLPAVSGAPLQRLPVEVNERVRYWMGRFTTDQRWTFERFLAREGLYGNLIRSKLRERGMPQELLYLAMIESGFAAGATSKVAAVGLWQFMGPTARQYGLRVDQWVDERRDPVEATDAALDYLEWLYDRYDSWYLAAAAYNAGPGRVDRTLRRQRATAADAAHESERPGDETLYWQVQHDLPPETREHVPRLLAATLLARDAGRNGFDVTPATPYEFDRVWVPGSTSLAVVARAVGAETALVRDLNPHLIRGVTPPGASYALRVPVGSTHQVVAAIGGGPWGRSASTVADDD
jgi:membrane-bound lytic murein transglycosylase D